MCVVNRTFFRIRGAFLSEESEFGVAGGVRVCLVVEYGGVVLCVAAPREEEHVVPALGVVCRLEGRLAVPHPVSAVGVAVPGGPILGAQRAERGVERGLIAA